MAWDKNLPNNQTKIRNYPTVLGDNFAAIEEAQSSLKLYGVNYYERNQVSPSISNDPSSIDDTMIVYSKQDAGGETELYVIDDRSTPNIIQLTEEGLLGSDSTQVAAQDITIAGNSFVNNQNNFVWAYGIVPSAGGAVTGGQGLGTATIGSAGGFSSAYTVPFSGKAPANTNYHVFFTTFARGSSNRHRTASLISGTKTTGQFSFSVKRTGSDTEATDVDIQVLVIGGF